MQAKTYGMAIFCAFMVVLLGSPWTSTSLADEVWVYNTGSGPDICVEWDPEEDNPVHTIDFLVTFADPPNPDVTLYTGSLWWRVESGNGPTREEQPATIFNIGAITSPGGEDYAVKIADGEGETGATDVESIVLTPSGDHHSSIASGSKISGDLTGNLTVQKDSSNNGGIINLEIGGSLTGDIEAYTITDLEIEGSLSGEITAGTISSLEIMEELEGDGCVTGTTIDSLVIWGDMDGDIVAGTVTVLVIGDQYGAAVDMSGTITADSVSDIDIYGDISDGGLDLGEIIALGEVDIGSIQHMIDVASPVLIEVDYMRTGSTLWIWGDLSGDISVQQLYRSNLHVWYSVEETARIEVAEMIGVSAGLSATVEVGGNTEPEWYFAGDLVLGSGISEYGVVCIWWPLTAKASIDLTNDDVEGSLLLIYGGAGDILNGGDVTGPGIAPTFPVVLLGEGAGGDYSGTATFASVGSDGDVHLTSGAGLAGEINVTGSMAGIISVDGDSQGDIDIGDNLTGEITFAGDVSGDIGIDDDVSGHIDVQGTLKGTGRILIDGLCIGEITIGEETEQLSQIVIYGGLDDFAGPPAKVGSITINNKGEDFDANGTIHIGLAVSSPPPAVVFDGQILIQKEDGGAGGGDLGDRGRIEVVGCHATEDDLDICICGDVNGTIDIEQSGCLNQVTWDCLQEHPCFPDE
jgi:hypothetical protein